MGPTAILVLVVEDEPLILETLRETLEEGGFAVTTASSAEAAFALLGGAEHAFRALITDINLMPGQATGWDVAHRARELVPGMPIIYMTGGSANAWSANGVPHSVLLTKPFVLAQVLTALAQLLNSAASILI